MLGSHGSESLSNNSLTVESSICRSKTVVALTSTLSALDPTSSRKIRLKDTKPHSNSPPNYHLIPPCGTIQSIFGSPHAASAGIAEPVFRFVKAIRLYASSTRSLRKSRGCDPTLFRALKALSGLSETRRIHEQRKEVLVRQGLRRGEQKANMLAS